MFIFIVSYKPTWICVFFVMTGGPDPGVKLKPDNTHYVIQPNENIPAVHCSADCNPACRITWRKTGNESILSMNGTLSISSLMASTSGEYVCTASRNGTYKTCSKIVTVFLKDEKVK